MSVRYPVIAGENQSGLPFPAKRRHFQAAAATVQCRGDDDRQDACAKLTWPRAGGANKTNNNRPAGRTVMPMTRVLLLISIILLGTGCAPETPQTPVAPAPTGADLRAYLNEDLRARGEALKVAVATSPTTRENSGERGRVLYDWINAWALSGGYVPVNATQAVSRIGGYGVPAPADVDELVAELRLHDEQPDALGTLVVAPGGPFIAGQPATFTQTYTVGSAPVQPGGGFLIAKHFNANHGEYQVRDPGGDNYVAITSSNPGVGFSVADFAVAGMHGGFRGAQGQLVFRVSGAALQSGDTVTITYGDQSGGGAGLWMPDFNSDQMPFPVYLDLDGSDLWLSLPIAPVTVVGSTVANVTGFSPSIVAPGESFELAIRAADQYGNRAQGDIPDWQILDNQGNQLAEVSTNDSAVALTRLQFSQPGVYRLQVRAVDGSISGEVNPVLVKAEPVNRIFWGETHGHSGFAEGIGSADAYMAFARDESRLDFVTHSEHDVWMDDSEWEVLRRMVQKYSEEGRFIAYMGYEWTITQSQGGHHNVLFRTPEGRQRVPSQLYPVLSRLYQGLREQNDTRDVLVIPHAHQRGDYRLSDPEMETLVEIMSAHGTFEWFARMYLANGHMVGFVAASDDHIGKPGLSIPKSSSLAQRGGLSAVYAPTRTTDAIFDAMKSLNTYATSGQRIILDVTVNGTAMGQRAAYAEERAITGTVIGTAPIQSVTLFRNDRVLRQWNYNDAQGSDLALGFFSESYPYHPQDNPRGWRHWRGSVEVSGATLRSVELTDLHNLSLQNVAIDPANPNRFSFSTLTRGDQNSLLLKFDGPSDAARLDITLEPASETGSGPPQLRDHQRIPGQQLSLLAADMDGDSLVLPVPFDDYQDTITLSRHGAMPMEVSFELTDSQNPRQGDFYFVRVRQSDEGLAWSSPTWVGGSPPR